MKQKNRSTASLLSLLLIMCVACRPSPDAVSEPPPSQDDSQITPVEESGAKKSAESLHAMASNATQEVPLPGIGVGEKAPAFELKDQTGKAHSLETLIARGPVACVFYRSADW